MFNFYNISFFYPSIKDLILNLTNKNKILTNSNLLDIAENFGNPVYVYESEKISAQYKRLTSAFAGVNYLRINYATKALSNISVLKLSLIHI